MKLNLVHLHFKKIVTMFPRNQYLIIKKVVTIPLLDHLLTELNVRFDRGSVIVYGRLVIVPVKMLSLYHKNIDWRQKFRPLQSFIEVTFPTIRL